MQKMISLLFCYFFLAGFSFASSKNLPETPWRAIEDVHKREPYLKWDYDISVKLRGKYSEQDSAMVVNALQELNELTETINLGMSSHDRGNLEVFFLDSSDVSYYEAFLPIFDSIRSTYTYTSYRGQDGKSRRLYNLGLRMKEVPDTSRQNFITNRLAQVLYPTNLNYGCQNDSVSMVYNSIFSIQKAYYDKAIYSALMSHDKTLLKAVYSSSYEEDLALAKKQFKRYHFPRWVGIYSHVVLIWPLVFILFILAGLIVWMYRKFFIKIKNLFLRFNVIALLSLFVFGLLISLFFVLGYRLDEANDSGIRWLPILTGVVVTLAVGLPTVNILRWVEVFVSRKSTHKFIRSFLLFLSISILPVSALFCLFYSFPNEEWKRKESVIILVIILLVSTVIGVIRALISFFVLKEKEVKVENELKVSQLRELKTKAELNALHSKINPHFLYNALNSIAGLAHLSAEKTEHMALALSKLFRYSINREQSDWSTLAEEVNMVKIYLDIEKVRFGDRLDFCLDLPEELVEERVPRFMIQPLVENAIKHGVSELTGQGIIKVVVNKSGSVLEVAVEDNGPVFPDDLVPGFGLQGIYDKLEILYAGNFELHFVNIPHKQAIVKILNS